MSTWKRGRELLVEPIRADDPELLPFITVAGRARGCSARRARPSIPVANPDTVPQALMHNLKHNCVLHEQNVILSVVFHERAYVEGDEVVVVTPLAARLLARVHQLRLHERARHSRSAGDLRARTASTSSRCAPATSSAARPSCPTRGDGMWQWRERLFAAMSRNAGSVVEFFKIPNNAVIELGTRVQI